MMPDTTDSSDMIDLASPARFRYVAIMVICTPFIGVLVWMAREPPDDAGLGTFCGFVFFSCIAVFPFTRSLHALILRPHFRANEVDIDVRHWAGTGASSWFLPFRLIRNDQLRWRQIRSITRKRYRHNGIVVEDIAIIESKDREPVHIHSGVFDLSVDAIAGMIQTHLALQAKRRIFPPDQSKRYVQKLQLRFAQTVALRHDTKHIRLAGLMFGPPTAIAGWNWLFVHIGERPKLEVAIALGACGGLAWIGFALDEAIRCWRFRGKRFWFRRDGLVAGSNEFSAKVRGWHEIIGAHRRVLQMVDQWDRPKKHKLDGMDVLLRDGETIWIPEPYSDSLDALCEALSPNDVEAKPPEAQQ